MALTEVEKRVRIGNIANLMENAGAALYEARKGNWGKATTLLDSIELDAKYEKDMLVEAGYTIEEA